jgi:nitroreductase
MDAASNSFSANKQNLVLDHIIKSRRTVRKFKDEAPPRTLIELVLQAGLLAPYGQIAVTRDDFRRFVVIPRESETTAKAASLIKRKGASMYKELEERMTRENLPKGKEGRYMGFLKMIGQQGLPTLGKVPYYVVVAEQKGTPDAASQSIAHCLENMWLKATALGLGLQLLSITERMAEDKEFCELLGIPFGEFALNGCLIGYPDDSPSQPSKRPSLDEVTRWL